MLPLFAQADSASVEAWLKAFFWLAGGVLCVVKLIQSFRGGSPFPQPMKVEAAHSTATQQDIKEVHGRISRERQEVDGRIVGLDQRIGKLEDDLDDSVDKLRLELKQDIKGVHDRVNDVLKAVSHLEGKVGS